MRRMSKGLVPLVALALVAAACGGDDDDAEPADEPTAEEPAAEPTAEEPAAEPTAEEPAAEPTAEEPTAEEPTAEEPTAEEPTAEEPAEMPTDIATDVGVTDTEINVGLLSDLTGAFAATVVPLTDGEEAYIERLNDQGGIAGRTVVADIRDTGYQVDVHQQLYDQMASTGDDGVAFIAFSTGSPMTAAIRSDLAADGLGAIPLSWNSSWAAEESANIFEYGTPYCVEAMNGITWLTEQNDATTVAIISFPGDYGEDGAIGAKLAAEQLGLEVVYDGQGAVVPGSDQTPVISAIVDAAPDIVWTTVNPTTLAEIMGGAAAAGYTGQWGGNGPSYAPQLMGTEVGPLLDQYYTLFTPYAGFNALESEGMADVVAMMREYRPDAPFQGVYVLSWIQGELLRQGLEAAAANGDLTRQGIVDAFQSTEFDMRGVLPNINYSGDPNDQIIRSSFVYDISAANYSAEATVMDEVGDGLDLIDEAFLSDTAANWEYEPCFAI
jgi:ABC-type branched-subunit amino acid transport system substrate-binding protein